MSVRTRLGIILLIIIATPFLGQAIGSITSRQDSSGLAELFGFYLGILGSIGSLVFGPLVSYLTRNNKNNLVSLLGYIIPSALVLTHLLVGPIIFAP